MTSELPLREGLVLAIHPHLSQVLILDAKVHRLWVRDDLSGLPGSPVGVGVRLLARALAASPKGEEPLPCAHAAAVVCESANILELLVKEHHVLGVALVIRQRRPDEVRLHRRDGVLAAAGRQSLLQGLCLLLKGSGPVGGHLPAVAHGRASVRATLKGLDLHLQPGAQRRASRAAEKRPPWSGHQTWLPPALPLALWQPP